MQQWLEHRDKVTRLAARYRRLIEDPDYKEILGDLFRRKVIERTDQINSIREETSDKTALKFVDLNAERRVFDNLLNNPEKYIREDLAIQVEMEKMKKEGGEKDALKETESSK